MKTPFKSFRPGIAISGIAIFTASLLVSACGGTSSAGTPTVNDVVTTLAGDGMAGFADDSGAKAKFDTPNDITSDGTNLYVADTRNNRIRQIVIATGAVTTLAGNGEPGFANGDGVTADGSRVPVKFNNPAGITSDGTNLFVADTGNNRIRKIVIASGVVSTFAGDGTAGFVDGDISASTPANFNAPKGITYAGTYLYVADTGNHSIRRIAENSQVTPLAGKGSAGQGNGTGTAAEFNAPTGITSDGTNLYVADSQNNLIRKIVIASGLVTTLAGNIVSGYVDDTGSAAQFNSPQKLSRDGSSLYVSDTFNHRIRKVMINSGRVTTIAGDGSADYHDDVGTAAKFDTPLGIYSEDNYLYVTDSLNHRIRRIAHTNGPLSGS